MARRCALIDQTGLVVNTIKVGDKPYTPPEGLRLLEREDAAPGDRWENGELIKPVSPPSNASPSLVEHRIAAIERALIGKNVITADDVEQEITRLKGAR